jgi:hypothetical protein
VHFSENSEAFPDRDFVMLCNCMIANHSFDSHGNLLFLPGTEPFRKHVIPNYETSFKETDVVSIPRVMTRLFLGLNFHT